MLEHRTVLLVGSDERERQGRALGDAGAEGIACPGPAPGSVCIGGREGYCPLLERADAVVLNTWLQSDGIGLGTSSDELLELYTGSGRTVVAIGVRGSPSLPAKGRVIRLDRHPEAWEIVAAVRIAPETGRSGPAGSSG